MGWAVVAAAALIVAGLASAFWIARGRKPGTAAVVVSTPAVPAGGEADEIRVICGSSAARYVDRTGNVWSGDRFFHGGSVVAAGNHAIARTVNPELFRYRTGRRFQLRHPLEARGLRTPPILCRDVFGENNTAGGGESSRVFRISINGALLLPSFDPLADAGGSNTADEKFSKTSHPAADGMLHVQFASLRNDLPFLNALEVMPGIPGQDAPVAHRGPRAEIIRISSGRYGGRTDTSRMGFPCRDRRR